MVEKLEEIVKLQTEVIKNIKIDKSLFGIREMLKMGIHQLLIL